MNLTEFKAFIATKPSLTLMARERQDAEFGWVAYKGSPPPFTGIKRSIGKVDSVGFSLVNVGDLGKHSYISWPKAADFYCNIETGALVVYYHNTIADGVLNTSTLSTRLVYRIEK